MSTAIVVLSQEPATALRMYGDAMPASGYNNLLLVVPTAYSVFLGHELSHADRVTTGHVFEHAGHHVGGPYHNKIHTYNNVQD